MHLLPTLLSRLANLRQRGSFPNYRRETWKSLLDERGRSEDRHELLQTKERVAENPREKNRKKIGEYLGERAECVPRRRSLIALVEIGRSKGTVGEKRAKMVQK